MKSIIVGLLLVGMSLRVYANISLLTGDGPSDSLTIELGRTVDIVIASDDASRYNAFIGFDTAAANGQFDHDGTTPEAGDLADATRYTIAAFGGYYVRADSLGRPTTAGVHFMFTYRATQLGETTLKLYNGTFAAVLDAIHITIIPRKLAPAFTWQGRLSDGGNPAEGHWDVRFRLFDQPDAGMSTPQGPALERNDVEVTAGYFQTELNFGADVFNGDIRWLEIAVRPGSSTDPNDYVTLAPRQQLTAAPYAIHAMSAADARRFDGRQADDFAPAGHDHNDAYVSAQYVDALQARIVQLEEALQAQQQTLATMTGLLEGVTRDADDITFSGVNVHIVNGAGATETSGGGLGNLIVGYNEPRASGNVRTGSHNIIVGKEHNYASFGGFVAGCRNAVTAPYASVSAGIGNSAAADYASVTGGTGNAAEETCAVVTGGYTNTAGGYASVVIAGYLNRAVSDYAAVTGGRENTANAFWATVTGGFNNTASGNYSAVGGGKDDAVTGEYDWRAGNNYFADQ